jgi:hypothetical protein
MDTEMKFMKCMRKNKNTDSMENGERKSRTAVTVVRFVPKLKMIGKIYYTYPYTVFYEIHLVVPSCYMQTESHDKVKRCIFATVIENKKLDTRSLYRLVRHVKRWTDL